MRRTVFFALLFMLFGAVLLLCGLWVVANTRRHEPNMVLTQFSVTYGSAEAGVICLFERPLLVEADKDTRLYLTEAEVNLMYQTLAAKRASFKGDLGQALREERRRVDGQFKLPVSPSSSKKP